MGIICKVFGHSYVFTAEGCGECRFCGDLTVAEWRKISAPKSLTEEAILKAKNKREKIKAESIDWEQRRYELAKTAMQGVLSSEFGTRSKSEYGTKYMRLIHPKEAAEKAIEYADEMIEQLKSKK